MTGRRALLGPVVTGLACAALVAGCSTGSDQVDVNNGGEFRFVAGTAAGEVIPVDERASAPDFRGTLLDGGSFHSAELAGHVGVLNFWGSWCPPCRVETPGFSDVAAGLAGGRGRVLGIDGKGAGK